jgi:hypothetical protein
MFVRRAAAMRWLPSIPSWKMIVFEMASRSLALWTGIIVNSGVKSRMLLTGQTIMLTLSQLIERMNRIEGR